MKAWQVAVLIVCTGCMSFNNQRIPAIHPAPSNIRPTVAYTAEPFGRTFDGETPPMRVLIDDRTAAIMVAKQVCRLWKMDKLIGDWGSPGEMSNPAFALHLKGSFNESGSLLAALLKWLYPGPGSGELEYGGRRPSDAGLEAGRILAEARGRGDDRLALVAIRDSTRCVELEARLLGELIERREVEVRERPVVRPPIVLTPKERAVLEPIRRRILLQGAPGFVEDAVWFSDETPIAASMGSRVLPDGEGEPDDG